MTAPLVLVNAVGLTPRLLPLAPRLHALSAGGSVTPLEEVLPAVTCPAQATLLTGTTPDVHGVVANGWHFRDTNEVRFWQQSNRLIEAEPFYATARRRAAARGRPFKSAKLFWWFNRGAAVDLSVTPKPHYGIDGNKVFDVQSTPPELAGRLRRDLGAFPFPAFWGPASNRRSSEWIAAAAACVLLDDRPDLLLVYLPHLDYDPQRFGPSGCDTGKCVGELDAAAAPLLDAANAVGARVWVVSEYGHVDVSRPAYPNRALRAAGLLQVRDGPFGEQLDPYGSRAFAVCDHQIAHVSVADPADGPRVAEALASLPGVARVLAGGRRAEVNLDHRRSGELILFSEPSAWFAYPFWEDDRRAPDYARCVAIHHKPGFDPCELFFDPRLYFPKPYAACKLLGKMLGFRTRFDVVPLDAALVRGSHGLRAADPLDKPLLLTDEPAAPGVVPMTAVAGRVLAALGLGD